MWHPQGRLASDRTGDNRGDAAGKVRFAVRIMWVGTANDHSDAVSDRPRSTVMWATVAGMQPTMPGMQSTVPWMGAAVVRSAMDPELFPMRVKFPASELAGADVLHETHATLRTRLNRHECRRTLPVVDGDPERLALVDGSNSLAFDEDVVGVSRLVVD